MKLKLLAALMGGACLMLSSLSMAQTSLPSIVDHTVKNNPDIAINVRARRAIDEDLIGAYSGYLPVLDAEIGKGVEKAKNTNTLDRKGRGYSNRYGSRWSSYKTRWEKSLTLQWNIFQTLGTYFEVERNKARMQSAAHKVAGTTEQIALTVVEYYLDVLRLRETVRLTQANLDNHQKTYDQIQMRAASGVGRRSDLDQAEARLALAKSNLVSAQANLRDAEINYQRFTGMPPDQLVQPAIPEALIPNSLEAALDIAHEHNPLYKQSKADVEDANAQYNAAKSPFGPRLDLEGGMTDYDNTGGTNGPNYDKYLMLRMRWNLFRGGYDMARLGATKQYSYEAMEIQKRTLMQLDQSTALSWNTLTSVRERLPSLKTHVDSALSTRDAYTLQFSIGQRTLIDLLDTENEYYTATVEYVNGQYLELFASYRLMADMGRLLNSLGVQHLVDTDHTQRVGWTNPWSRSDYKEPLKQIQPETKVDTQEATIVPETSSEEQLQEANAN